MNATNTIPGFTAEDALYHTVARYRTAVIFNAKSNSESIRPAMTDACKNIWNAFMAARADSPEEIVSLNAYFAARCR